MEEALPLAVEALEPLAIENRNLTARQFNEQYGYPAQPVLMRQQATDWLAVSKWTEDYLVGAFGDTLEVAERVTSGKSTFRKFSIRDYLAYANQTEEANPYYLNNGQFHLGTHFTDDYQVPDYFQCWYNEIPREKRKQSFSWIYIGAGKTYSALHLDIWQTSAWNCLISGQKLWLFYDASQADYLYGGKVNPFNPDYEQYPDFAKAKPLYCLQNPGDVVFTPSTWWHTVYNVEKTVSLTENFINETNCQHVLDFFKSQNADKAYQSMKRIVDIHLQ